jgi:hypothetical protein
VRAILAQCIIMNCAFCDVIKRYTFILRSVGSSKIILHEKFPSLQMHPLTRKFQLHAGSLFWKFTSDLYKTLNRLVRSFCSKQRLWWSTFRREKRIHFNPGRKKAFRSFKTCLVS